MAVREPSDKSTGPIRSLAAALAHHRWRFAGALVHFARWSAAAFKAASAMLVAGSARACSSGTITEDLPVSTGIRSPPSRWTRIAPIYAASRSGR